MSGVADGVKAVAKVVAEICAHPENEGRRARRLARWATWQVWKRTVRRPWTVTLHGDVQMICHARDTVTSKVLYCGLYDSEEMRFLLRWLRPGDRFLDVGANVSPYSLLAAGVGKARVTAFEPGELARRRASDNLALNRLTDGVSLVAAAVSDTDGEGLLTTERFATNHLVVDRDGDRPDGAVTSVRTVSLDSYAAIEGLHAISLIKIDVEGHETAVLHGAETVIRRDRPALIVEVNEPLDELRHQLDSLGYEPVRYDTASGSLATREFPQRRGGNALFVASLEAARRRLAPDAVSG